jgi:rubrerythrin
MKIRDTGTGIQLYDFTAPEAYRIACKIEHEGIRFYQLLIDKAADAGVKELVTRLRDAEAEHLKIFEQLLAGAGGKPGQWEDDDLLDSVDDAIFSITENQVTAADFGQALQLGIIIEKRSLAFYLEVEKHTAGSEGKHALRQVIDEERRHWEQLKQLAH